MPSRETIRRPTVRRLPPIVAAVALSLTAAGCVASPSAEIAQAELLLDISDAVNALRSENASLQDQVDLLETTVARQDTLLRRLAAVNGVPVPSP